MPGTRAQLFGRSGTARCPGLFFSTPTFSRASIPGPYYLATGCLADFLGSGKSLGPSQAAGYLA